MDAFYPVTLNGKHCGKVMVSRKGLYYCFSCKCCLYSEGLFRLMVACNEREENLGILVPADGAFVLNKRIPIKKIGDGELFFRVVSQTETYPAKFIPISPEEPFAYISRLKESFLVHRDGQSGIRTYK